MTTGMVLGKFYPPTLGHGYLVDFARHYVDRLTVVVGSLERESIPGGLRVAWMREWFPDVDVRHLTDENPQFPEEHPDFWTIWRDSLRRLVPTGPDFVFASEPYGFTLASVLGARYIPVDHARTLRPISGTAVRADPLAHWDFLPPVVRPYFVRRVAIVGPESTGKTTLAARLAAHYGTVMVGEYARGLIDAYGTSVTPDLFPVIVNGQTASEAALARQATRLLVCDSDAFTTALYHELYLGARAEWIELAAARQRFDLYLLTDCDTPFVADVQRQHPERRRWFFDRFATYLDNRQARYAVVRGDWEQRFETACAVIDHVLLEVRSVAP